MNTGALCDAGQSTSPAAPPANHLQLRGVLVERKPMRYTPAGIPILNLTLEHRSQVVEAGISRQVEMSVPALAAGKLAAVLERKTLGAALNAQGFLAPRSRNSRTLVFHMTECHDTEQD